MCIVTPKTLAKFVTIQKHTLILSAILDRRLLINNGMMSPIKRLFVVLIPVVATIIILHVVPAAAETIDGGAINTKDHSITMLKRVSDYNFVLIGVAYYSARFDKPGKLIVVHTSGETEELEGEFKDAKGTLIEAPTGNLDKVIYLDRDENIYGGIGLSPQDAKILMFQYPETFGQVVNLYLLLKSGLMIQNNFQAIEKSMVTFDSELPEDKQVTLFESTLKMLASKDLSELVHALLTMSHDLEHVDSIGKAPRDLTSIARGVYTINNDNFADTNLHAVIQGWTINPNLPPRPAGDLNLGGITMFVTNPIAHHLLDL